MPKINVTIKAKTTYTEVSSGVAGTATYSATGTGTSKTGDSTSKLKKIANRLANNIKFDLIKQIFQEYTNTNKSVNSCGCSTTVCINNVGEPNDCYNIS
jgi:hypothetical protein